LFSFIKASLKVKKDQQSLKSLIESKKVAYVEYDVASDEAKKEELRAKAGKIILPALLVDGVYKGDYDWAADLEEEGKFSAEIGA